MRTPLLASVLTLALLCVAPLARSAPGTSSGHKPAASAPSPVAPAPSSSAAPDEEDDASNDGLGKLDWQPSPKVIDLGHSLSLALPEKHMFLGRSDATKVLAKMGSFHSDNLLGLVVDKSGGDDWVVTIRYDEEGYVKDDEKIDADELMKAIKEGTEEGNAERVAHGFKPLHVDGWSEQPHYDRAAHRLIWALTASSENGKSINYNTRILGRHGIVSLNLVVDPEMLDASKPEVASLLAGTAYQAGSRYEDFDSKTDKVAEYGLTGLILGAAGLGALKLAKVGFIAAFWKSILAFFIAAKKAVLLGIAAVVAFFKRLAGKKNKPASAPPSTDERA